MQQPNDYVMENRDKVGVVAENNNYSEFDTIRAGLRSELEPNKNNESTMLDNQNPLYNTQRSDFF